jgi:exonuclease III
MRDNNLGILAIQETHLNIAETHELNGKFKRRIRIINSSSRQQRNAAGVAIVLNKQYVAWKEVSQWEIIPGRALLVQIPWRTNRENKKTILAIYAPNNPGENKAFWEELRGKWTSRGDLPIPDFMLGDLNLVEDSIDRIPAHEDDHNAVESLRDLKTRFNMIDGWRAENGDDKAFTYLQTATGSQSRIDRIYMSREIFQNSREWLITTHGIASDHKMISMQYFDPGAPKIGEGRWVIPHYTVADEKFIKELSPIITDTLVDLEFGTRTENENPQKALEEVKSKLREKAKQYIKEKVPIIKKRIAGKERELASILNNQNMNEDTRKTKACSIELELKELQVQHHTSVRERIRLKYTLENKTIGKTWIQSNKDLKPRDYIAALQKTGEGRHNGLEYDSEKMALLAKEYHDKLQKEGVCFKRPADEREEAVRKATDALESRLSEEQKEDLDAKMTAKEMRRAIYSTPNDKAPGLDGIPAELWKALTTNPNEIEDEEDQEKINDAAKLLAMTYNDMVTYGVAPGTNFAEGWMCPIYKKKDKMNIANYRPITVLNTDYKAVTKAIAERLTGPALNLIHKDQAGFMKGRRIENQTDLIRMMINYGSSGEARGMLVFLDQEKAYDKITHDFLFRTLEKMNFPATFINGIKSLYGAATTKIMINGFLSESFNITRGVRQGDPLSCLLFNLAIESLAYRGKKRLHSPPRFTQMDQDKT